MGKVGTCADNIQIEQYHSRLKMGTKYNNNNNNNYKTIDEYAKSVKKNEMNDITIK